MQLGMHFAIDDAAAAGFLAAREDEDALAALVDAVEEGGVPSYESDKAWDPISCALAPEGEDRVPEEWPAYALILGEEDLTGGSDDLMVAYLSPATVAAVSAWLDGVAEADFAAAYADMPEGLRNPEYGPDEEGYAWGNLDGMRPFFADAVASGAHVIFHVNW